MKDCPFCAEEIQDKAVKCKHCGEWLKDENSVRAEEGDLESSESIGDFICSYFYPTISDNNQVLIDKFCDNFPELEKPLDSLVKNYLTSYYPGLNFEGSVFASNYLEATKLSVEELARTVQFGKEFPEMKEAVEILTRMIFFVHVPAFGSGVLRMEASNIPNYLDFDNSERFLKEFKADFNILTEIALIINLKIKAIINYTQAACPLSISEEDAAESGKSINSPSDAELEKSAPLSEEQLFNEQGPRPHHYAFAHKLLCEMVFGRPDFAFRVLNSPGTEEFLKNAWAKIDDLIELDENLPSEGLSISKHTSGNNTTIFLVIMPKALRMGEAHFVAILLQTEQSGLLKKKIRIKDTKYYTLEFHNEQESMLCQWGNEGTHMNLGDFGTPNLQRFLEIVKEKI